MRIISLLLLLLLSSPVLSQIKSDATYAIGQPIVLECTTPVPPDGTLKTIWETSPGLSTREFGKQLCIWVGTPGDYKVAVTTQVTREVKLNGETLEVLVPDTFKKYTAQFTILGNVPPGPTPTPVPVPNPNPLPTPVPTIPPDRFDNIGQRVNQWVSESVPAAVQSKRTELSKLYADTALGLENATYLTINDSNQFFVAEKAKILTPQAVADGWAVAGSRIGNDLSSRKLSGRQEIIEYYRAVAAGLK